MKYILLNFLFERYLNLYSSSLFMVFLIAYLLCQLFARSQ